MKTKLSRQAVTILAFIFVLFAGTVSPAANRCEFLFSPHRIYQERIDHHTKATRIIHNVLSKTEVNDFAAIVKTAGHLRNKLAEARKTIGWKFKLYSLTSSKNANFLEYQDLLLKLKEADTVVANQKNDLNKKIESYLTHIFEKSKIPDEVLQLVIEGKSQEALWWLNENSFPEAFRDLEGLISSIFADTPMISQKPIGRGISQGVFGEFLGKNIAVVKKEDPQKGLFAHAEVGAYVLDQALGGTNLVPLTVFKYNEKNEVFSAQLFVPLAAHLEELTVPIPDVLFFDLLADNNDRKFDNLLQLGFRLITIDNGMSFRGIYANEVGYITKEMATSIVLAECCSRNGRFDQDEVNEALRKQFGKRSPTTLKKVQHMSDNDFRALFFNILPPQEIENFILRKTFILNKFVELGIAS